MHHVSAGPVRKSLKDSFAAPVLMMSSNSAERDGLVLSLEIIEKGSRGVRVVIGTVVGDLDAVSTGEVLKGVLGVESLTTAEGNLVVEVNIGRGMVNEYRATMILRGNRFFAKGMGQTSRFGTDILIGRDTIIGSEIVLADGHELFRLVDGLGRSSATTVLASKETSSTLGRCSGARVLVLSRNNRWVMRVTDSMLRRAHQILEPSHASVAKALVDEQQFFPRSGQVVILIEEKVVSVFIHRRVHQVELKTMAHTSVEDKVIQEHVRQIVAIGKRKHELISLNSVKVDALVIEGTPSLGGRIALVLAEVILRTQETDVGTRNVVCTSANEGNASIEVTDGPFDVASTFDFNGIAQAGE